MINSIILSDYTTLNVLYNWIAENMRLTSYTQQSDCFNDAENFSASIHYKGCSVWYMTRIYINNNGNITEFSVKE